MRSHLRAGWKHYYWMDTMLGESQHGVKTFECDFCTKTFVRRDSLIRHLQEDHDMSDIQNITIRDNSKPAGEQLSAAVCCRKTTKPAPVYAPAAKTSSKMTHTDDSDLEWKTILDEQNDQYDQIWTFINELYFLEN